MWHYSPPLRDWRFVIDDVLQAPAAWAAMPALAHCDADTAALVLAEAGKFTAEVLAPLNGPGDVQGCQWTAGEVRTPDGYAQAYQAFVDGGWPALAAPEDAGGQGLPHLLNAALNEMLASANHGWTMYPGLLQGAMDCLYAHATGTLRERYLPKVVSGEWLSTMCLTEPQAGSDLGLIRTRAVPLPGTAGSAEPAYALSGTKIFISGGEHDLTPNIVHLVLARLDDPAHGPAPVGTRGLTLFVCPKLLPDGSRNGVHCDGIEHKMGIKGSATCVMRFDGATGWMLGEPHRGLAAMFLMMNSARLHVGLQGLGHLEVATQNALRYAQERLQSRAPARPAAVPAAGVDPLSFHPAVRRTLWRLKARTEAGRVLTAWAAQALDEQHGHTDAAVRDDAGHRAALLTPVIKALLTDLGHHGADEALGVWGGHGYLRDWGIEQVVRDSRVSMIYEGTNQIQAQDLLLRKVLVDGGARLASLLAWASARCEGSVHAPAARNSLQLVGGAATQLKADAANDGELPFRAADAWLMALGEALLACAWARMDAVATQALAAGEGDASLLQAKQATARFQFTHLAGEVPRWLSEVAAARHPIEFLPDAVAG